MQEKIENLKKLYAANSKHSNYQVLAARLANIIGNDEISVKSRYEIERLDYILSCTTLQDATVLDVGGNSGFFTFELLDHGAKSVHHFEGNKAHSDFVRLAAEILGYDSKVKVTNDYYSFNESESYDVILLLNVLHHIGDDYGDKSLSVAKAKEFMIRQINSLSANTNTLVLQIGFCWKGNRNLGLFSNGTKEEMIQFIKEGVSDNWEVENIGIAGKVNGEVVYTDINEENVKRDDSLGEFLNRPIFILKRK